MHTSNIPYKNFENFVLRSSVLPLNFYFDLTKNETISDENFKKIWLNKLIQEAIFLASPTLYFELTKWTNNEKTEKKEVAKLKKSFLKYLTRMSSRCTPFGLFAGCKTGAISNRNNVELNKDFSRATRLDMNYLVALSQDLSKVPHIQEQLLYYPNNSLYEVGNQLRYIEYYYINAKRKHQITAVENNEYLTKIIERAKEGANIDSLCETIIDKDISKNEALGFINQIIDSQILTSELEPSVTGEDFFNQLIKVLSKINHTDSILQILLEVKQNLSAIDNNYVNSVEKYISISNKLKSLGTKFELKYLFQTDLKLNTKHNTIDKKIIDDIKEGMHVLNLLSPENLNNNLQKFTEKFQERYEEKEMPLSKVLDLDIGIGYLQNQDNSDSNPLIDELAFPNQNSSSSTQINWTEKDSILHKKLITSIINKNKVITLEKSDLPNKTPNWNNLPDTISSMIQIVKIEGKEYILMNNVGGSSAANLLGRFCLNDEELNKYVNSIAKLEKKINEDKIIAEIVHLPESRVGNILARPHFREYEIPYLAKSSLDKNKQIDISDLSLQVKQRKIILKSISKDKEILPRLSTAHNYQAKSLPIYHLLCDLQTQKKKLGIGFNFGPLENEFNFLPRIVYKNIIFSSAQWKVYKKDITHISKEKENPDKLLKLVQDWRDEREIPQFVSFEEGDNILIINLGNIDSIKMFLSITKKYSQFKLKEYLFTNNNEFVTSNEENYANQFIISFYKTLSKQ